MVYLIDEIKIFKHFLHNLENYFVEISEDRKFYNKFNRSKNFRVFL